MKTIFAPGCDLRRNKKAEVKKVEQYLNKTHDCSNEVTKCCRAKSDYGSDTRVIIACPGCYHAYAKNCKVVSLWEIIDSDENYDFVDYQGKVLSIHDPCIFNNREMEKQFDIVRSLAVKMNIKLIEPVKTKNTTECCGDIYIGKLSEDEVLDKIKDRANQMPTDNVLVYCMGCYESMKRAGKSPIHIMELL